MVAPKGSDSRGRNFSPEPLTGAERDGEHTGELLENFSRIVSTELHHSQPNLRSAPKRAAKRVWSSEHVCGGNVVERGTSICFWDPGRG
jgi:hypothetical protein